MPADVLSDVLRTVRLTGAVFFDFNLSAPWVAATPPARAIAEKVMPGAQRVIEYHVVARGECWGEALGEEPMPPVHLREGDIIVFPQGNAHILSSEPGMRTEPDMTIFTRTKTPLPLVFERGGGGPERTRLVCGFLGCDERPFNPLLTALPIVIHLQAAGASGWLGTLMTIAVSEAGGARAGGENVLARVSELMFVEVVRRHLEMLPPAQTGWLAGLRDPVVGLALAVLHGAAEEPWTVERLARLVGASRSVLAERFTELVGQPPMQYLALWRMQLASRLLAEGRPVAAVADAVGYESETAFSRAFKKVVGQAPAAWRRSASPEVPA